jgi:beta-glucosidase-like glycosyl hydrolase
MRAITSRFSTSDAAGRSLAAGADIALLASPTSVGPLIDGLERDVHNGSLSERQVDTSVLRVLEAKAFDPCR